VTAALHKVQRGDPLAIPASTFNAFVDAARAHRRNERSVQRANQPDRRQADIVLVRNDTAAALPRFGVLAVAGPVISPVDNADAFTERPALRGTTPSASDIGRFVILLEPIRPATLGRACIAGICHARVEIVDETHGFADVRAGYSTELESTSAGAAQLLWIQPSSERDPPTIAWCLVRLGLPQAAGGSVTASFAQITSKAGSLPPYRYAAVQATMGSDGAWTPVGGGAAYNNVFNLEEQGAGGQWVDPLVVGDIVLIFAAPDPNVDAFVCTRSHYRGTY
jgi:hypothetical protein